MKNRGIIISILIIILVFASMAAATYSVVINVSSNDGINEIINEINLRDLVTLDTGGYNDLYYDILRELDITSEEIELLMDSDSLNEELQIVLKSVVSYKIDNDIDSKLGEDDIYNLIVEGLNKDIHISNELKNKVLLNSRKYIKDIVKYMYDIDVLVVGNK